MSGQGRRVVRGPRDSSVRPFDLKIDVLLVTCQGLEWEPCWNIPPRCRSLRRDQHSARLDCHTQETPQASENDARTSHECFLKGSLFQVDGTRG